MYFGKLKTKSKLNSKQKKRRIKFASEINAIENRNKEKSTQNKTEQTPWNLIFGEEKN